MARAMNRQSGFTLLELSIVLVVAGLLIGAVLGGKQLIESSKIRADISTVEKLNTAVGAFKLKYGELPGDITTATSYFATCDGVTTNVANGDGNGITASDSGTGWVMVEPYHGMIELGCAGLVSIGSRHVGNNDFVPGNGFPASKVDGGGGIILAGHIATRTNYILMGQRRGWVSYDGGFSGTSCICLITNASWPNNSTRGTYTTVQAKSIDTKMDDGLPGSGGVRSLKIGTMGMETNLNDYTSTNDAAGCQDNNNYNSAVSTPVCALRVKAAY